MTPPAYSHLHTLSEMSRCVYIIRPPARFVILVAGTLVYGRGDEEATKEELTEALAASDQLPAATLAPADEETAPLLTAPAAAGPSAPVSAPSATRSVPVGIRAASPHAHAMLSSSLKATMTITHGSYSRSLTHSSFTHRGSFTSGAGLAARVARERSSTQDDAH